MSETIESQSGRKIAIDPGNIESAYILFEGSKIYDKGKVDNKYLKKIIIERCPSYAIIEGISSMGMPVGKTVFETCYFIGQLQQLMEGKYELVLRRDIKMHLCGTMRAKDANIRAVLIDRFGSPGTKKAPGYTYGISKDIWSSLAIMTYHNDKMI